MTRVLEHLFLGSLDDADQLASLNPNNITTVIVLCRDKPQASSEAIEYFHIPISDACPIPKSEFERLMLSIGNGVKAGKVLVCCGAGMSRSPSILAAYLHRVAFLDFEHALQYLKKLRPVVNPSETVVKSIGEHLRIGKMLECSSHEKD